MISQRLDGRLAVVTGANKGLGKQMAEASELSTRPRISA